MTTELENQLTQVSNDLISTRNQLIEAEASVERLRTQKHRLEGAVIALTQLKNAAAKLAETPATE